MEAEHTFYIIYLLESDIEIDGKSLGAGYYKYVYDLTGQELPMPCQWSKDRYDWEECPLFKGLGEFQDFFGKVNPKPMKLEREDYIETIYYRGQAVPVFCDDYGQCFYCIMNNEVLSFGSFQPDYEEYVKKMIDRRLDNI